LLFFEKAIFLNGYENSRMEVKTNNPNIIYLDWEDKKQVEAVSRLHIKLLPESILSELGFLFLSKFYYSKLSKDKLIDVYLYKENAEYVGFISCTNVPFIFMRDGMKKHFFSIVMLLAISIILKPIRLVNFVGFLLKMKKDTLMVKMQNKYGDKIGEFLSFGVVENSRKSIDPIENITVSNVLMKLVSKHFRASNIEYALLRILKMNTRAITFYQKHSGVILTSEDPNQVVIIIETKND
jgi:hypothetical protein